MRAADNELIETHQRAGGSLSKAYAAVIDVWTLAKCDILLHNTESNLVLTASIINPSVQLKPVGTSAVPTSDASTLLAGVADYEDFTNGQPPSSMIRAWTLIKPRRFRLREGALGSAITDIRMELVRAPTASEPLATTVIFLVGLPILLFCL